MRNEKLYRAYQHFNHELFGGVLPENVVLTLGRMPSNYFGVTITDAWVQQDGYPVHEISLNANNIRDSVGVVMFYGIVIHEMIHLWHKLVLGDENPPHNENFRDKCRELGLIAIPSGGEDCLTIPEEGGKAYQAILTLPEDALYDVECVKAWIPPSDKGGGGGASPSDQQRGEGKKVVVNKDDQSVIITEGKDAVDEVKINPVDVEYGHLDTYDRHVCPICGISVFVKTTKPVRLWCDICHTMLIKEAK